MTTSSQVSLGEVPQEMADTPDSDPSTPTQAVFHDVEPAQRGKPADMPTDAPDEVVSVQKATVNGLERSVSEASTVHVSDDRTAPARFSISIGTAVGLLGGLITLFGSAILGLLLHTLNSNTNQINNLNGRITAVETNLNGRITAVETNLSGRIDALDGRITAVETGLSTQIAELAQWQADTNTTLSVLIAVLNARSEVDV